MKEFGNSVFGVVFGIILNNELEVEISKFINNRIWNMLFIYEYVF